MMPAESNGYQAFCGAVAYDESVRPLKGWAEGSDTYGPHSPPDSRDRDDPGADTQRCPRSVLRRPYFFVPSLPTSASNVVLVAVAGRRSLATARTFAPMSGRRSTSRRKSSASSTNRSVERMDVTVPERGPP